MLNRSESAPAQTWRHATAVFLLVLGNYLLSAPRNVMLDDDGYFILAAWFGGVAHPPGYPLYTLIAGLFAHLPLGSVAFRVHICSAVLGALACAVLWALSLRLTRSRLAAWIAALSYGCSGEFWSQATVAEVYSLNAFLFFLLLWLCTDPDLKGPRRNEANTTVQWIAGIFGLSLSNHWPLMVLSAPALAAAAWPHRLVLSARPSSLLLPFCLGLLPYAWMVFRSQLSEIAFYGPIENWNAFWFYLSREAYRAIDHSLIAGWEEKLRYAGFALAEAARQFGWLGTLLGLIGLIVQWRVLPRPWCWALLLGFSGSTLVLAAMLGFDWDLLHRHTFQQYPLVAYGILAIWVALGARALVGSIRSAVPGMRPSPVLPWALGVLLVASVWLQHAPAHYRAGDHWAADFAGTLLESLAPDSTLFTFGDYGTGPLAYLNLVAGVRPDVRIFNVSGQLFSNRLVAPRGASAETSAAIINTFIERQHAPVYYNLILPHRFGIVAHGLFYEVGRDLPAGMGKVVLTPRIEAYFGRMFASGPPVEAGQLIHYRQLTAQYCRALAGLSFNDPGGLISTRIEQRCGGFYGLIERAEVLLGADGRQAAPARKLLFRAQVQEQEIVAVKSLATLDYLLGLTYHQTQDPAQALEHFRRSWSRWPDLANPARAYLDMDSQPH